MFKIFDNLNPQQGEAVKEVDKPLLIIAGAGSGKTLTVASKIAYLIQKGVHPENILAVTFNQKAAEELKTRVTDMLGAIDDLTISTFHSFCNQFIQDNLLSTKLNANFKVITDTAQLVYLTKNINNFGLEHLEFNHEPYTLAEEIKKFISRCKDEYITPNDLQKHIQTQQTKNLDEEQQNDLNNLKDIHKIYTAYETYKTKNNMLDFGDMLCIVYDLLKNKPLILKRYQKKFQHIIVDEFQDTNYIQLQIVNLLAKPHGHITVVGDDDQSIYRFRGAYLTNIAEFRELFPNYTTKALEQNYRSTKKILAIANKLIEKSPERTDKKLFTENPEGQKVTVTATTTDTAQANYIFETVKDLLKNHALTDIAILCRRRAGVLPIIDVFRKHKVPFNFVGESGFFQEPIIKDIISYLKVANNPAENNAELARILHRYVYNLKPAEISRFNNYAHNQAISLYEAFEFLEEIKLNQKKFVKAKQVIDELVQTKKQTKTLALVHRLLFELDFYKYEIALDNKRNLKLLNKFYEFTEEFNVLYPDSDLDDFTDYLTYASNFDIDEEETEKQAITVSTIHGVKGMQFPVVIVPDVVDRKLPTRYTKDKFPIPVELLKGVKSKFDEKELHLHEERRLFYVAITRAKEKLYITYAKRYGNNKTDSKPSKFLEEIDFEANPDICFEEYDGEVLECDVTSEGMELSDVLVKETVSAINVGDFAGAIHKVLLLAKINDKNFKFKDLISELKEPDCKQYEQQNSQDQTPCLPDNAVFSISQFNTYKRCPRIYRYRYLLHIPEKPKYFFDFGASLHNVVEQLTKMIKDGSVVDFDVALGLLEKYWRSTGYKSKLDETRDYEEAKEILKTFLEEQAKLKTEIVEIEKSFETKVDDFMIRGRIDRIDKDGDDYIVIDYKTAKRASSERELKKDMQLLLYSLVTEEMFGKKPSKVGIWYLRPNQTKLVKVEDEDLEAIRAEMRLIVENIKAGKFDPTPGWECRNCDYDCLCDK